MEQPQNVLLPDWLQAVANADKLSMDARLLAVILSNGQFSGASFALNASQLAKKMQAARSTVVRAIAKFKQLGLIAPTGRVAVSGAREYLLTLPSDEGEDRQMQYDMSILDQEIEPEPLPLNLIDELEDDVANTGDNV